MGLWEKLKTVLGRIRGAGSQALPKVDSGKTLVDISPDERAAYLLRELKRRACEQAGRIGFLTDDIADVMAVPPGAVLYPVTWTLREDAVSRVDALAAEFGLAAVLKQLSWLVDFEYLDEGRVEVFQNRTLHHKEIFIAPARDRTGEHETFEQYARSLLAPRPASSEPSREDRAEEGEGGGEGRD